MKNPLSKTLPAIAGCAVAALFGVINLVGQDGTAPQPAPGDTPPTEIEAPLGEPEDGSGTAGTPDTSAPQPPSQPPSPPIPPTLPGPDGEAAPAAPGGRFGVRPPGGRPGEVRPELGVGPPGGEEGAEGGIIRGDAVTLQFPNNPVTDLLGIYERLTGKTIIKDTAIFEGASISLVTPKEVTKDEAIRLIESSLLINGYALISLADGKSVKILPTRTQGTAGQPAFSEGLKMYRSPDELPLGESVVTYFMQLDQLDPIKAGEIFNSHVGLNVYGRITPVTSPPGLLITENASIVRQLVNIQAIIDVSDNSTAIVTEFIELEYADAATVAQILQASIDARDEAESSSETISGSRPQAPQGGDPRRPDDRGNQQNNNNANGNQSDKNQAIPDPPAQLVADDRLNRIMVVATPDDYLYLTSLIREFDQPIQVKTPLERPLNYAYSLDLLPVLADILQDTGTGQSTTAGGGAITSRNDPQSSSSVTSLTGRSTGDRTPDVAAADSGGRADQITAPEEETAPVSVLVGKTRIIADPQSNSIIALGPKEDLTKIGMLIDKLDKKPPQVYLATVIGKLQLGDGFEFGVDYLQKFINFSSSNPDQGGVAGSLLTGRTDVVDFGNVGDLRDNIITSPFGPDAALNIYGQIGQDLDVFITALETTDRFKVLSRPSVYALNNKKAVITSGQSIPVPTSSTLNTSSDLGNTTTQIEYKDVVLKLEVVPLINADGEITLTIAQVNDTVTGTTTIDQNEVPIIQTEQLSTTVTIPDLNTVVLGGLITEQETESVSGVPILSKIPVLGVPFRTKKSEKVRSELVIFIQPIVVKDNDRLREASYSEDSRTEIGAEAYEAFPDIGGQNLVRPIPANQVYPAELIEPDGLLPNSNDFLRHPLANPGGRRR